MDGLSRSPGSPTLDDETERAAASPPPLWGRDRVGGIAEPRGPGIPPPLAPPHKGEGDPGACLSRIDKLTVSSSLVFRLQRFVRCHPRTCCRDPVQRKR